MLKTKLVCCCACTRVWAAHTRVCSCQACVWRVWVWREVISLSCVHSPSTPCCLDEVPRFTEHLVFKSSSAESTLSRPWDRWRDGFGFAPSRLVGLLFEWVLIGKRFFSKPQGSAALYCHLYELYAELKRRKWELGRKRKRKCLLMTELVTLGDSSFQMITST